MYQLDSLHVWHVAKSGNDGNSGHAGQYPVNLASDAKLTIGAAITAASAGDTIIIWPGTYAENVILNKQLQIIGTSRAGCKIQVSSGTALKIQANGCVVKSISAVTTGTGSSAVSIQAAGYSNLQLIDCYGEGDYDGIAVNGNAIYMFNCHGKSNYDGIQLGAGSRILIDNCIAESTGSYSTSVRTRGLATLNCSATVIRNTVCYVEKTLSGNYADAVACEIQGEATLENLSCRIKHTGTGNHQAIGLYICDDSATSFAVSGKNISIHVETDYGYGYGIKSEIAKCGLSGIVINIKPPTSFNDTVAAQVEGEEKVKFITTNFGTIPNDYFNDWWVIWTSGNNVGQVKQVLDWERTPKRFTLYSACTYDIQAGDAFTVAQYIPIRKDIKQSGSGILRLANCEFDKDSIEGTVTIVDSIVDTDGRVDVSKFNGNQDDVLRINKATKLLTNKAVQNKTTGAIDYYDDDGETVILTHTPADGESTIQRTPS